MVAPQQQGVLDFKRSLGRFSGCSCLPTYQLTTYWDRPAVPIWIRFETEAPVDDILVATSEGGFTALQAKTTVSLSAAVNGGLRPKNTTPHGSGKERGPNEPQP